MAAKAGFKDFLLQKGEKLALFGAVALLGVFLLWGVVTAAGADNPDKVARDLENSTNQVRGKINSDAQKPEKLPIWAEVAKDGKETKDFPEVAPDGFAHRVKTFEPVDVPSLRRDQPRVLTPIESQINYYAASYKAYDRIFSEKDGEFTVEVGLLTSAKENAADKKAIEDLLKSMGPRKPPKSPQRPGVNRPQPAPGGPAPGGPGPGGPGPGPGGPRPPIGGPGGGPVGMPGMPGVAAGTGGNRSETKVIYKSIDEALKLGYPPAVAVYPIRMAVIQMSFPLEAQLQEIKQALRLRTLWEARQESSPATIAARSGAAGTGTGSPGGPGPSGLLGVPPGGPGGSGTPGSPGGAGAQANVDFDTSPAFTGLVVERMVVPPEGIPADISKEKYESLWEPLDHQERFFNRFTRYDAPFVKEEGYKPYFLRPEQGISAPLPVLADGFALNYPPDTTLGTIYANYKRLEDSKAQKKTADDAKAKYKYGSTNPYAPPPTAGGYNGSFGDDSPRPGMPPGMMGGNFRPPMGGFNPMPGPGPGPGPGGESPSGTGSQPDPNKLDVDHLLMRFLDVDVVPGNSYRYRVKVLMKSPNFRNKENVSDNTIAGVEILESAWYELPQRLTVPEESFLYAYPAKKYEEAINKVYEASGKADPIRKVAELQEVKEGKRAIVQMQQWIDRLRIGSKQEPIGGWIQAEMPVAVGDYVGKRVPVELPLWRSAALNYVLPQGDTKTPIYPNWPKDTNNAKYTLPKMRVLDFRTKSVLVDFEGGHTNTKVGNASLGDDSDSELLILRDDGKIEIRSEARDMVENTLPTLPTPRAQRDQAWKDWLERIRKIEDTESTGTGGPVGPGRPGGDGGR